MKSIYIPPAEDTELSFDIGDRSIVIDMIDLDEMLDAANSAKKDSGQSWLVEFADLFNNRFDTTINKTQAYLIYEAHRKNLDELKKKSSIE